MDVQSKLPNNIAGARQPIKTTPDEVTESGNKQKNMDSGYSYAKDINKENKPKDITEDLSVKYDNKRPQEINIWRHRNTSNPDFYDITKNNSGQILSNSVQTNTSGMTYDAIDVYPRAPSMFPRAQSRQGNFKQRKRQTRVNSRVIKAVAVIFVFLVLGVIAFFIVRSLIGEDTPESCDQLSTVENGNVSMSDGSKTIVDCKEGYGPQDSLTITCRDGKWSLPQPCPLVDCGDEFPAVANGMVDVGSETTFNSTARLQCIPGFMLNATTTFICLANGTWGSDNQPLCIPHPCGPHNLSNNVLVREDFSHINMTMDVQCEDGFEFASGSDTYINCENGTWINNPRCEVPVLYFTEDSKMGEIGSSKTIQCVLKEVVNLTNVIISRHSSESKLCEVIISERDISGSCRKTGFSVNGIFLENNNVFTTTVTLAEVSCESEGLYVCRTNIAKTEMDFRVTSNVTVPYLRLPVTLVEDQPALYEEVLECTADLGYPLDNKILKIEIKLRNLSIYQDYSPTSYAKAMTCNQNATVSLRQETFSERHNGSTIRCVIRDENNTVIVSSLEKSIILLKNVCLDGSAGDYDPHPFNCRRYIRCVGTLLYDHKCAHGSCAMTDSDPICNNRCSNCP